MIYKKTCKTCGKIFESKRIEAQYCSKKCFYSRVGKHKKPRVKPLVHKCKVCGMICKEDICEDCLTKRIPEFEKLEPICYICGANIPEGSLEGGIKHGRVCSKCYRQGRVK